MKTHALLYITFILLLSSCKLLLANKLAKSGSIKQDEFLTEIPIELYLGWIILKVEISGEQYSFLLDSGAPNVFSTELAEKLKLINLSATTATDSDGNQSSLNIISVDNIAIGGINFLNTAAIISPLNLSKEITCLKIDGFIGSNLMRKVIWKVDFKRKVVTITNSIETSDEGVRGAVYYR